MSLAPGANVLVVGNGPVHCLAARLAAIKGYQTTLAAIGGTEATSKKMMFDDKYPEDSIPLSVLTITGEDADESAVQKTIAAMEGMIVAFDDERTLPEASMNVFMPLEGNKVSHVSVMSRYLNGKGMGFTASAAKIAANKDVWAGGKAIDEYKEMEAKLIERSAAVGAATTIIRAGTLKGGASGGTNDDGGGGVPLFLNPFFYSLGQQDVLNWRLLYDCEGLGVEMTAGDTLPGPGFTAALTATERVGSGDSHRGAIAMSLVEALGCEAAKDKDFSIAAKSSREFPKADQWPAMFAAAK